MRINTQLAPASVSITSPVVQANRATSDAEVDAGCLVLRQCMDFVLLGANAELIAQVMAQQGSSI